MVFALVFIIATTVAATMVVLKIMACQSYMGAMLAQAKQEFPHACGVEDGINVDRGRIG